MFLFLVLVIVSAVFVQNTSAQFEEDVPSEDFQQESNQGSPNQQQQAMNQEIIEALWNVLSPNCKTEMESALSNRGEITNECRAEVQQGLISLGVIPPQQAAQSDSQGESFSAGEEDPFSSSDSGSQRARRREAPVSGGSANAILGILAFVAVLFGGAIGYIVYFNQNVAQQDSSKKPKKLSKKKEEKLRMKGGNR